ncbi:Arm DNA-binding domain-containing protein [Pseudoxanthomonas putridarboris]|uniref:Arm DNA-binding domain-containing protein n=1 Tax=Pseudoxanthomonas putridarboris TaxID=752605 RepID=A0ABU9J586_9GAMM
MALTDTAVRQAKPERKDCVLQDTDGVSLYMMTRSGKSWHFRFSWAGKQPRISLGTYPEVSLREARERRGKCRALVAKSIEEH